MNLQPIYTFTFLFSYFRQIKRITTLKNLLRTWKFKKTDFAIMNQYFELGFCNWNIKFHTY